jgi:hypothetical protein
MSLYSCRYAPSDVVPGPVIADPFAARLAIDLRADGLKMVDGGPSILLLPGIIEGPCLAPPRAAGNVASM